MFLTSLALLHVRATLWHCSFKVTSLGASIDSNFVDAFQSIKYDINFMSTIDLPAISLNIVIVLILSLHVATIILPFKGILGIQCAACFQCLGYCLFLVYQVREFQSSGLLDGYTVAVDAHPLYGCLLVSVGMYCWSIMLRYYN
jgi:hypothetical protein